MHEEEKTPTMLTSFQSVYSLMAHLTAYSDVMGFAFPEKKNATKKRPPRR